MTTGARQGRTARGSFVPLTSVLCAGILATTGLSGCSGDSSGSKASGSRTSPSAASGSASPATPADTGARTAPKQPRATAGRAGQQSFARYVMAAWSYALDTDDAKPLVSLSPAGVPCRGCAAFTASMAQRRKQGWSVDFPGLRVRTVKLDPQGPGQTYAKATVDVPRNNSFFQDGTFRNTSKAHRGATFEILMTYSAQKYRLLAFTVS